MTSTNRVRAAAELDLAKLIASATVAETTVTAYTDRAAVQEWADLRNSDTDEKTVEAARQTALASRIQIRVRRSEPAARAEAIARFGDDRENTIGFPSETVYSQRIEHIVGSAVLDITNADGAKAAGPVDQATMARLRAAIGERAWGQVRDFATGDTDDSALDADFSQAPSGATPA